MLKILNQPNIKHIHFIGIGGIGMSGLAEILFHKGYQVSGSDLAKNNSTRHLKSLGITVYSQHVKENIQAADAIVYSSIISETNPEYAAAKTRGLPLIQRGQLLADLMLNYDGIAVAGTHGKTTTTAIAIHVLLENNNNPSYALGGVLKNYHSPSRLGAGKFFVAESDESDASFLYLNPKIAIVTNIDADHLSTYQNSFERLKHSFEEFLKKIPMDGLAILNSDDPSVVEIRQRLKCRTVSYGFHATAEIRGYDYQQKELQSFFKVKRPGTNDLLVKLNLPGMHNASNALSVIALAHELNTADEILLKALENFPGVGRRFHAHGALKIKEGKALIFDDYGHHPNEIKMTLQAAKQAWPNQRVVLVFQPHRFTRTRDLMEEFAEVLKQADLLILLEVYSAGETPIVGINSQSLCQRIIQKGNTAPILVSQIESLPQVLKEVLISGDVVLFQGAGSVGPLARTMVDHEFFRDLK